jgi:multidrug/hemolysin transport system ATP-binding protein
MNKIIEVKNLKKSYGSVEAVAGIDFYVEQGKLFAFLGPNGAGKSTTIDVLCTLLQNDSGEVVIDGKALGADDHEIRRRIGVVFQDSVLDKLLTVKENLVTRGELYGLSKPEIRAALKKAAGSTGINDFINRPYGKLSGGQRRRADIARALMNTPKILFLDEPTTGLDPQTRRNIWETVRNLQSESGMTVFLTTHYMEEAAGADYVVVIDNGLIAAKGTPTELKQQYSSDVMKVTGDTAAVTAALDVRGVPYTVSGNVVTAKLKSTADSIDILHSCRDSVTNVEVLNGTMDDAFIAITGKGIRE